MSDKMMFVLHHGADARYADAIAVKLDAVTAPMQDGVRFGAGAICVVVWSEAARNAGAAEAVVERLPWGADNTVLCCLGEAFCPVTLRERAARVLRVSGDDNADAGEISAMVEAVSADLAQIAKANGRRTVSAPQLASRETNGSGANYRKSHFAARSATGLVATLAVVGVVGPAIVSRPQAVAAPNPTPSSSGSPHAVAPVVDTTPVSLTSDQHAATAEHYPPVQIALPKSMTQHEPQAFASTTQVVRPVVEHTSGPVVTILHHAASVIVPAASETVTAASGAANASSDDVQSASADSAADVQMFDAAYTGPPAVSYVDYAVSSSTSIADALAVAWPTGAAAQTSSASSISAILEGRKTLTTHQDDALWGVDSTAGG